MILMGDRSSEDRHQPITLQLRNRSQQLLPISERCDAEFFKVVARQLVKRVDIDPVFRELGSVVPESSAIQTTGCRCSTTLTKARPSWLTAPTTPMLSEPLPMNGELGPTSRRRAIEKAASRSADGCIGSEILWNGSSISSNTSEASQPAMTENPRTSSRPSNSSRSGYGSNLMSLRLS